MQIQLDGKAVWRIRRAATDAVSSGDTDTLLGVTFKAFSDEQVEVIERRLASGDFFAFLTDVVDEWGGEDVDEYFALLRTHCGDLGIDLSYAPPEADPAGYAADVADFGDDEDDL